MLKTTKKMGVDFNKSDFPEEAKMCLGFLKFLRTFHSTKYATNYNLIAGPS